MATKGGLSDSTIIGADKKSIIEVLIDFEAYPDWMSRVIEVEVLERDDEDRGTQVRYVVDAVATKISYVLEYSYLEDSIEIGLVEGDLDDVSASYTFEPLDDDRTEVTYYYEVSYSIPLALRNPITKRLLKQVDKMVMKSALKDLKRHIES